MVIGTCPVHNGIPRCPNRSVMPFLSRLSEWYLDLYDTLCCRWCNLLHETTPSRVVIRENVAVCLPCGTGPRGQWHSVWCSPPSSVVL